MMGILLNRRSFPLTIEVSKLVIYVNHEPTNSVIVSLNKLLADELLKIKPSRRTMQLENCFIRVLSQIPAEAVIRDIDVLFNPAYKVDAMRMLVEAYRKKRFSLIWAGTIEGSRLIYSEENLLDYKSYEINDYDIVCVV